MKHLLRSISPEPCRTKMPWWRLGAGKVLDSGGFFCWFFSPEGGWNKYHVWKRKDLISMYKTPCMGWNLSIKIPRSVIDLDVEPKNNGWNPPQIIHVIFGLSIFYKPSILGETPLFLETPRWAFVFDTFLTMFVRVLVAQQLTARRQLDMFPNKIDL